MRGIDEEQMKNKSFEEQFWKLKVNFERQSNAVFTLLSNFKNNHQSAPYLAQLLLRIDYNNYFTQLAEIVQHRAMQDELIRTGQAAPAKK